MCLRTGVSDPLVCLPIRTLFRRKGKIKRAIPRARHWLDRATEIRCGAVASMIGLTRERGKPRTRDGCKHEFGDGF